MSVKKQLPEENEHEVPDFNQKALAAWKPGTTTKTFSDPTTPGLVLRMSPPNARNPRGSKVYYFTYRMGGRGTRFQWLRMSDFDDLPLVRARELARGYRTQRDQGIDPTKALDDVASRGTTVEAVCKRFEEEYAPKSLKEKSRKDYADSIRVHIIPALGKVPIRDLTRDQVAGWHSKKIGKEGKGAVAANRALAVLSSICTQAEVWGLRKVQESGENPCKHVDRFNETPRVRDIQPKELEAIGQALRDLEGTCNPWALAAVKVVALCAGRVSEVLALRRDKDTYLDEGYTLVRDHKTARKAGAKHLELPPAAIAILRQLPEQSGNPWFFPSNAKGTPITRHGLHKTWIMVCKKAEVLGLHIHDFRSFAASEAQDQGIAEKVAATLLGHTDTRTTQKHYAKVRKHSSAEASAKISAPIAQAFGLTPKPEPKLTERKLIRRFLKQIKA